MSDQFDLSRPTIYQYGTLVVHPKYGDGVIENEYIRPTDPKVGYTYFTNSEGNPDVSGYTYWETVKFYKNLSIPVKMEEL